MKIISQKDAGKLFCLYKSFLLCHISIFITFGSWLHFELLVALIVDESWSVVESIRKIEHNMKQLNLALSTRSKLYVRSIVNQTCSRDGYCLDNNLKSNIKYLCVFLLKNWKQGVITLLIIESFTYKVRVDVSRPCHLERWCTALITCHELASTSFNL